MNVKSTFEESIESEEKRKSDTLARLDDLRSQRDMLKPTVDESQAELDRLLLELAELRKAVNEKGLEVNAYQSKHGIVKKQFLDVCDTIGKLKSRVAECDRNIVTFKQKEQALRLIAAKPDDMRRSLEEMLDVFKALFDAGQPVARNNETAWAAYNRAQIVLGRQMLGTDKPRKKKEGDTLAVIDEIGKKL